MKRKVQLFGFLCCVILLVACSNADKSETKAKEAEKNKYEKLVEQKNSELELLPLELTSYAEEIGATLSKPKYQKFAANGKVTIEGKIEQASQLQADYAWIKIRSNEEGPAGSEHEYYAPIKDGAFKQTIHFFNGEGDYQVTVQLPSTDAEDYFYDTASFEVINVNPEQQRDLTYTPFGILAGLSLDLKTSYVKENQTFLLKGEASNLTNGDSVMLSVTKDSEEWKHLLPIKDGKFEYEVPLFYGKGLHEIEVLVPDAESENYYQLGTNILVDNESEQLMKPIEFSDVYIERGVTLEEPTFGGVISEGEYHIKGSIDPNAEFAEETTHIYVTSVKGEDEALDVIPVKDFSFDDSFYLRFGPGTYEITVSVPEIIEENSDRFRYFGFAKFEVESTGEDKRDLLPARGVQSDDPKIIQLAEEITQGKATVREKTKAIYDYVAQNISYDVSKMKNDEFEWDDSALKTLEEKTGVCQDYAYLAIALLRAANIEARFIEGTAMGGFWPSKHAWVEAKVDGNWLVMDPTWGAGYIKDDQFVAAFNEEYFDPNMQEFEKTHYRTGVMY
ncbi:transglutaminase domain-containing protein [Robertmurraya yapensis]|uniref:Transglutaminase domain-containing protein n=2 Tax=Bacillaceae TaxID=186817 RepID=A0A3S0KX46_9BACI|nr:transglutaminase-like domain-containing protein [Bacillus yapensis]RTR36322.1 transglutaminase domain-containing protein [Bacillus yapensis]TKT05825.1 transglutaminase domain-containing protein [Bacillus yapensis]